MLARAREPNSDVFDNSPSPTHFFASKMYNSVDVSKWMNELFDLKENILNFGARNMKMPHWVRFFSALTIASDGNILMEASKPALKTIEEVNALALSCFIHSFFFRR